MLQLQIHKLAKPSNLNSRGLQYDCKRKSPSKADAKIQTGAINANAMTTKSIRRAICCGKEKHKPLQGKAAVSMAVATQPDVEA